MSSYLHAKACGSNLKKIDFKYLLNILYAITLYNESRPEMRGYPQKMLSFDCSLS